MKALDPTNIQHPALAVPVNLVGLILNWHVQDSIVCTSVFVRPFWHVNDGCLYLLSLPPRIWERKRKRQCKEIQCSPWSSQHDRNVICVAFQQWGFVLCFKCKCFTGALDELPAECLKISGRLSIYHLAGLLWANKDRSELRNCCDSVINFWSLLNSAFSIHKEVYFITMMNNFL